MPVPANRVQPRKSLTGNRVPLDGKPAYLQLVTRVALEVELAAPSPLIYAPGCPLDIYLSGADDPSTNRSIGIPLRAGDAERMAACAFAFAGRGPPKRGGIWLARYALARWLLHSDPHTILPPTPMTQPSDPRRIGGHAAPAVTLSPVALAGLQYLARVISRRYRPTGGRIAGEAPRAAHSNAMASPGGWLAAVMSAELRRLVDGHGYGGVVSLDV